jgi:Transposase DDE domain
MAKHFELAITDTSLAWSRKAEAIAVEAALDGIYVIRSNLPHDRFPAAAIVLAYKGLSHAERGFRDLKSGDLDVRPIHHRRAHRVLAHVFLCMLAYYVIWHMKRDLAPMLIKDDDPAAAAAQRSSPVATPKVSPAARRKATRKRTEDGQPVHSFRTLPQDLANLTRNLVLFGDARPHNNPRKANAYPVPRPQSPRPQDRCVGRTRSTIESHQSAALNILGSSGSTGWGR